MGWLYNFYSRIMPASKKQVNTKTIELNQSLSHMEAENKELIKKIGELEKSLSSQNRELQNITRGGNHNLYLRLDRVEELLEMGSYGVTKEKRPVQIIVTLTTYEKRIATLPMVLERLINQTVRPDRIILYLSEDNFPKKELSLPQRILDFTELGLELRWCKGDIKSYKKLIPALKEFPEDIIITVDDDIYYELDVVEKLYDSYRKFPNVVSTLRAHYMNFDEEGNLLPYDDWDNSIKDHVGEPSFRIFATGAGGILYPPHIFPEEVLDENLFMNLCPTADDVWFKFMAVMNRIPTVLVIPYKGIRYVEGTQDETLWSMNKSENDIQIQAMLDYYRDYRIDGKNIEEFIFDSEN